MRTSRTRTALAHRLLGLSSQSSDVQRKMAARVGELAVRDLIEQCLKCLEQFGPGILTVQADNDGYTRWVDPDEIQANLHIAEQADDQPMIRLQRRILQGLDEFAEKHLVFVLIIGMGQLRLYQIPVDTAGDDALRTIESVEF